MKICHIIVNISVSPELAADADDCRNNRVVRLKECRGPPAQRSSEPWLQLTFKSCEILWRFYTRSTGNHRLPAKDGKLPVANTESSDDRSSQPKSLGVNAIWSPSASDCRPNRFQRVRGRYSYQFLVYSPNCEDFVGIAIMRDFYIIPFISFLSFPCHI